MLLCRQLIGAKRASVGCPINKVYDINATATNWPEGRFQRKPYKQG